MGAYTLMYIATAGHPLCVCFRSVCVVWELVRGACGMPAFRAWHGLGRCAKAAWVSWVWWGHWACLAWSGRVLLLAAEVCCRV